MAEPIDPKKLVDVSPTALVKSTSSTTKGLLVIAAVVGLLFCVYFTVKSVLKPKPTQDIHVASGGKVEIKNEANKRWFIIFVEPWFGTSTQNKWDAGIRAGVRVEF